MSACVRLHGRLCVGRAQVHRVHRDSQVGVGQMAVAHGHPRVAVPEQSLQAALVGSARGMGASKSMSQIVKVAVFDPGALARSFERT